MKKKCESVKNGKKEFYDEDDYNFLFFVTFCCDVFTVLKNAKVSFLDVADSDLISPDLAPIGCDYTKCKKG